MIKRPLTSVELGLMRGGPPSPERLVTGDNWIDGPFNRWGFLHGLCVLQDDKVVYEYYVDPMTPDDTHLLMSVSKSLTATLVGVLVGQGVLDPAEQVTRYVGALRGTAWEGCTLQHLLDMRAGTRFDEDDYLDPESDGVLLEYISGYRPKPRTDLPPDTYQWIMRLDNDREHGSAFKYRSILTDVLAWAATEATGRRFPDLFSDLVWSRIGSEHDADVIVDAAGFPVVEGGIATTLRDLARFGLMHLQDGRVGDAQVVPAEWIGRLLVRDDELIRAFEPERFEGRPDACYHDQWWVWDAEQGIYSGYGINGQQLLVHRPANIVVARFSSWPERWSDRYAQWSDVGVRALLDHLTTG